MFSSTTPPGASVAWPPRDERQGWHLPPTRGGRCDGGVNAAAARADRAHCPGVPDRPRRTCGGVPAGSAPMPVARCAHRARRHEGSLWSTGGVSYRRRRAPHRWRRDHHRDQRPAAATTGNRGAPGGADRLWPDVSGNAITSRRFTRDNWNYRAQKSVPHQIDGGRVYHVVIRIEDHGRS